MESCGNVFKDLGSPYADVLFLRSFLFFEVKTLIKRKNLDKEQIIRLFGIHPSKARKLMSDQARFFSIDQLMFYLNLLGFNVIVTLQPAIQPNGTVIIKEGNAEADKAY